MRLTDAEARERAARVESSLERLESAEEPARALATEALQSVVELYGEALARLVEHVPAATLAADDVIAHVLLLHGLHPVALASRVASALQGLRPMLATHAADVSLMAFEEGVARLALRTAGQSCASTTATLRHAIEEALQRAAPDLAGIQIDAVAPPPALIPVESIRLRARGLEGGAPAVA